MVGTHQHNGAGSDSGAAYVYVRSGCSWSEQAKLTAGDAAADDQFGLSVNISGDLVVVGPRLNDDAGIDSGSAYVFGRNGSSWNQQIKLTASDAASVDYFGVAVAVDGDTVIVGAYLENNVAADAGSAYIFASAPSGPSNVVAIAGKGQATVRWDASLSDRGTPITMYTVTSAPDGISAATSSTTIVITGLTNGTSYTFSVTATNSVGSSTSSSASNAVTPVGAPNAPLNVTAMGGNAQATVSWAPLVSDGGATITMYTVTSSPGTAVATSIATSTIVTGLANGTAYTFLVRATNSVGTGASSTASNSITPATIPDAPTNVIAITGENLAIVSWDGPAFDGGTAVTGYNVTSDPDTLAIEVVSTPTATTTVVTGLQNRTEYTFTVTAINALGVSSASSPSGAVTPTGPPAFLTAWGGTGIGAGQFDLPFGVGVSPSGDIYVADDQNNRIQRFTRNGVYVSEFGSAGVSAGQFNRPIALEFDAAGNLYVADVLKHRIQKFTAGGAFILTWGFNGSGDSQFDLPYGLAVDSTGNAYVADAVNKRIQKVSSTGVFITKWGTSGTGNGQFMDTSDVAVDSSDHIYVSDSVNHNVQVFTADGVFLTKWGTGGTGDGEFDLPSDIDVSADGRIHVGDTLNDRIQMFGQAEVPDAPTSVAAMAGVKQATVNWDAPAYDGFSTLTLFTVTSSPGGIEATTTTITGLADGTTYTFTVTASNIIQCRYDYPCPGCPGKCHCRAW